MSKGDRATSAVVAAAVLAAALAGSSTFAQQVTVDVCSQIAAQLASRGTGVREPSLVNRVEPSPPDSLRGKGLTGAFGLQVVIGPDGKVFAVTLVTSSLDQMAQAVIDAVRQWEYTEPTMRGVSVYATVFVAMEVYIP